jgi:para-aminobenzoate synthetase/4-amino-4-deoxychorismate lyase
MEEALAAGFYLAGFLSYEAGYAFEEKLYEDRTYDFPLIHFGVFSAFKRDFNLGFDNLSNLPRLRSRRLNISKSAYFQNIQKIKDYIAAGDTYQITYCLKLKFDFSGDPYTLYKQLLKEQPIPYPAYIQTDDFSILSLSPEMFVRKIGKNIKTKPMKGTWPRGNNFWEDLWAGRKLHFDPKNRAENIMIADLLRNDLGRLGLNIQWPRIFEVARYHTLFQMTSTITGKIDPQLILYKLFASLHPSGSVTGAPKIRSMEIIRELESEERKIYTGAIGYIAPNKDLFFNIPIRTLLIQNSIGEMGVGGGIVWDSTPEDEFEECLLKARFLTG